MDFRATLGWLLLALAFALTSVPTAHAQSEVVGFVTTQVARYDSSWDFFTPISPGSADGFDQRSRGLRLFPGVEAGAVFRQRVGVGLAAGFDWGYAHEQEEFDPSGFSYRQLGWSVVPFVDVYLRPLSAARGARFFLGAQAGPGAFRTKFESGGSLRGIYGVFDARAGVRGVLHPRLSLDALFTVGGSAGQRDRTPDDRYRHVGAQLSLSFGLTVWFGKRETAPAPEPEGAPQAAPTAVDVPVGSVSDPRVRARVQVAGAEVALEGGPARDAGHMQLTVWPSVTPQEESAPLVLVGRDGVHELAGAPSGDSSSAHRARVELAILREWLAQTEPLVFVGSQPVARLDAAAVARLRGALDAHASLARQLRAVLRPREPSRSAPEPSTGEQESAPAAVPAAGARDDSDGGVDAPAPAAAPAGEVSEDAPSP